MPTLIGFAVLAFVAGYCGRNPGIFVGHLLMFGIVALLDNSYAAQRQPPMDRDLIFSIGVVLRTMLLNTLCLPPALAGALQRHRQYSQVAPRLDPRERGEQCQKTQQFERL